MAFWKKCNKILQERGAVLEHGECPCTLYAIAVRCHRDDKGNPKCLSCKPRDLYSDVFVGRHIICNGTPYISDGRQWYSLAEGISYNNWTYILLDGPDSHKEMQDKFDEHDAEYWGEKALDICQCCCLKNTRVRISFSVTTEVKTEMGDAEGIYMVHAGTTSYSGSGEAEAGISDSSCSVSTLEYHYATNYYNNTGFTLSCESDEASEERGRVSFNLTLNDNCTELLLTAISARPSEAGYDGQCINGSYYKDLTADVDFVPPASTLAERLIEGSWSFNFSKGMEEPIDEENWIRTFNQLQGSLTVMAITNDSYSAAYDDLDNRLK